MTTGRRVLVVEDSPAQAALVRADLEEAGFEVTHVEDGERALERLDGDGYDVVLSDVVMPGIDGYELCRRIKEHDPNLPVVLLTSLDDPIEIVHGLEAGADNFLRKPYDAEQLVSRLRLMIFHRESRGSGRASVGLEVILRDRRFLITAERQQILDLLISSFEDLVDLNRELQAREAAIRTAQDQLRSQLLATEQEHRRLLTVLGATPDAIAIMDLHGTVTDVSASMCRLLGREEAEVVGRPASGVFQLTNAAGQPVWSTEMPLTEAFGESDWVEYGADFDLYLRCGSRYVPVFTRAAVVRDPAGAIVAYVGVFHEIGTLSAHHSVTRLPNQSLFVDRVARGVEQAGADGWTAVMAVVIDQFAGFATRLTLAESDELLAEVAGRLRASLRQPDLGDGSGSAGYFGHDTFAVVLPHLEDELDGVHHAQRVAESVSGEPLHVGDHALRLSVTVGLALARGATGDPIDLVGAAISAARRAAGAGPGTIEVADPEVDARADDWLRRQAELEAAIEEGQLCVLYQPELDLRTGATWGVEALVRWDHPERGLLPPSEFLPLAEETGLIVPLGWWVLGEACAQTAAWRGSGLPQADQLTLSVNLDVRQLADPEVTHRVQQVLDEAGLDPGALVLEITETGVLQDVSQAADRLREIKALGVQTAIDDFGTGYSSLLQLRRLPVDFLKIDQTFVDGMGESQEDATIVAATVRLARALGIDSVAEGVETEDQLVQLRMLGCDYAQGYLWARPMAAHELTAWWSGRPTAEVPVGPRDAPEDGAATGSVDDVIAYLVHELRSPLTVIAGFADLALGSASEEVARYVEPISRGAREVERRLASLADARDAGQGTMRLVLEEVDVGHLVETLVRDVGPQLEPHPITVTVDDHALARADRSRLTQAVTNLLVNAAKFSPPDAPVDVGVKVSASGIAVSVRDRGPGVPDERRPELFRRFSRLGVRGVGMGVGLHLVRAIARAHGGDALYEPAAGGGSCFAILLPAAGTVA